METETESIEEAQQLNVELKISSHHTAQLHTHTRDSRRFISISFIEFETQSWERFSHNSSPMPVCIIDDKPSIHKSIKLPLFLAETMRIYFCISLRNWLAAAVVALLYDPIDRSTVSPSISLPDSLFFSLCRAHISI